MELSCLRITVEKKRGRRNWSPATEEKKSRMQKKQGHPQFGDRGRGRKKEGG